MISPRLAVLAAVLAGPAQAQVVLPIPQAARLAAPLAPFVHPTLMLAIAYHESGLRPHAIHDNTTGTMHYPRNAPAARAIAAKLVKAKHNLDLGLMQINVRNLSHTGLTVATALDPAASMQAASVILTQAFWRCSRRAPGDAQAALRCAASIYNTGSPQAGIANGYQARVWAAAGAVIAPWAATAPTLPAPALSGLLVDLLTPPAYDPADRPGAVRFGIAR